LKGGSNSRMSDKKGPFDWIKEKLFPTNENQSNGKKNNRLQYFLILLLFGIAIMLISNIWSKNQNDNSTPVFTQSSSPKDVSTFGSNSSKQSKTMKDYEDQYESELKDALEQIDGVGKIKIVVNVGSTESKVYEKNSTIQNQTTTENDQNGGERKVEDLSKDDKLVTVRDGENEVPIVTETRKPNITGVLVVAEGAKNITIQRWIKEAIARTLDVPDYKVSVMPKKS
jgi:stage III sporulation protein AG